MQNKVPINHILSGIESHSYYNIIALYFLRCAVHPLDRHILAINQYLNIGLIQTSLRSKGTLTDEEMEQLLDLSIKGLDRAVIVETLMKYMKSKGGEGMTNFMSALEETQDGTGHATIIQILNDDDAFNEVEEIS